MNDERKEMEILRDKAARKAKTVKNSYWKRAYLALADAADRIAAMSARTEDKGETQ